jgi:hypothetical protein
MSGTTKLKLYNEALWVAKERKLIALDSPAEEQSQIELDRVWDGGAVDYCLEKGLWNHAMRTQSLTYDPDTTPAFGHPFAFNKPSDFIRTASVCLDENFTSPILDYRDEGAFWFAQIDTIYIRYVSNDNAYGNDLTLWPQTFVKYVASYLAWSVCGRLTQSDSGKDAIEREMMIKLLDAKAKDAIAEPTKIPPTGTWVSSRGRNNRERGSRSRLIG